MAGVSVLVVDDDDDMRELVRTIAEVRAQIATVREARDGASAVEMWRQHHPDVVVMDQRMPEQTGLEAAQEILREDPTQAIILFSAFLTDTDVLEAQRIGIRDCLAKDEVMRLADLIVSYR